MWGSAPEATLAENALMGYEDSEEFSKKGILNINKVTKHAVELISKFRVKADSHTQKIKELFRWKCTKTYRCKRNVYEDSTYYCL